MTYPAHLARPFVLRARRDTIALVAAATAMTFALAHMVHAHRAGLQPEAPPQQAWTGDLAGVALPDAAQVGVEPLTSASLVVPQSDLALPPQPPMRPLLKLRGGCGGRACLPKTQTAAAGPVARSVGEDEVVVERRAPPRRAKPSLMSRLNPLNHLPDASTMKRPFVFAGDAVSGWFRGF